MFREESDITRLASDECVHSKSPALALGLAAAIALLVAQIISNALGGCICCESGINDPSGKTTPIAVAISCLTLSWVTFSIAFLLLVAGASINDKRDNSDDSLSTGCYVLNLVRSIHGSSICCHDNGYTWRSIQSAGICHQENHSCNSARCN
ncbi:hypothetical protein L7F22_037437 [Adiantum nelumboides]|nr:hypothetical protein [Adiantum nelumboides]